MNDLAHPLGMEEPPSMFFERDEDVDLACEESARR